jgi:CHAT domain-containing protein
MTAGAGAFVGTLWAVPSGPAREFAEAFYAACLDGVPLGRAVKAARAAIRRPGDPTWLAYTAYGDPAATVAAGPYLRP